MNSRSQVTVPVASLRIPAPVSPAQVAPVVPGVVAATIRRLTFAMGTPCEDETLAEIAPFCVVPEAPEKFEPWKGLIFTVGDTGCAEVVSYVVM